MNIISMAWKSKYLFRMAVNVVTYIVNVDYWMWKACEFFINHTGKIIIRALMYCYIYV